MKTYEKGEVIFKQGDEGESYYFVLRGTIDLFIYDVDQLNGQIKLKHLTSILPGSGFGELALMYGCPRTATAISNSVSNLIIFKKRIYNSLVKDLHEKAIYDLVNFYYSIPIFKNENIANIIKICLRTQKRTINAYELCYRLNDYITEFCFIYTGEIKVVKKIKFDQRFYHNLPLEDAFVSKMKDLQLYNKVSPLQRKNKSSVDLDGCVDEVIDIMAFTTKDMFGEYYAVKGKKLDVYFVATQPSELFTIKTDEMKSINPEVFTMINKLSLPVYNEDRVFINFHKNLTWKLEKKNLLKHIKK
jgi:hypothetical protein